MLTPEQLTRISDINSAYLGIDTLQLMENAGSKLAREIKKRNFNKIAFFCGTGNNGGDGLVAARHLSGIGKEVKVYMLCGDLTREAEHNFNIIRNCSLSIELEFIRDSTDCERIKKELKNKKFDCVVDALIGVGISGGLREPVKTIVDAINSFPGFKVAADVPTGGKVAADLIVSFHVRKCEGKKVTVEDIGIPKEAELLCGPGDVYLALPGRLGAEHKGDFGRLLVIGGSKDYVGAPLLVDNAARKTGVDLIFLNCPRYVAANMQKNPNLIINSLDSEFYVNSGDINKILNKFKNFDAIVVGNGIGTNDETRDAVSILVKGIKKPVVMDADALKLVSLDDLKLNKNSNIVLTPHSKEFEILFNEKIPENIQDKIEVVEKYARETKTTIVLKGAADTISNGEQTKLNKTGNAGMTVGGTGDVLAGIIGGLAAQNKDAFISACAGTFLCGLSGDFAYENLDYGFTATDVVEKIPGAIKFCRKFF